MSIRIEYMALSTIVEWPRNVKGHRLDSMQESFERFGYVSPLIIDEGTGRLTSGHGRLRGLMDRKERGEAPPERIEARADDWYVPVVRGIDFKNEAEAAAYLIADNRIAELGGWVDGALPDLLKDLQRGTELQLAGTGFTMGDLDDLVRSGREDAAAFFEPGTGFDAAYDPDNVKLADGDVAAAVDEGEDGEGALLGITKGGRIAHNGAMPHLEFENIKLYMTAEDGELLREKLKAHANECGSYQGFAAKMVRGA